MSLFGLETKGSRETKDDLQNHHLKMKAMGIINISYLLISLSLMDDEVRNNLMEVRNNV